MNLIQKKIFIFVDPPTEFICNRNSTCGCSSVPVIFYDSPDASATDEANVARIVGGESAQPYSWPWIVSVRLDFLEHICGGSIINEEWILTAAHCFLFPNLTKIHIGIHQLAERAPQIRTVQQVIRHPRFVPPPQHINDIALLRLETPLNLSALGIQGGITCLPVQSYDLDYPRPGTRLAVIGWGATRYGGSLASTLQQVRVITLDNNDRRCINASYDQERQFCAMVDGGGKDSCQGKLQ